MTTHAFTDGACLGNPGPGGWAWAVPDGAFASGAAAHTTNQRMEVQAAAEAVQAIDGPLEIVSDSTYVVNCFRDRWWEGWLKRGWVNSAKKPVANRDLWEPFIEAVRADPGRVTFTWIKGHSGDRMNDLVDRLAVEAANKQHGRTGAGTPADVGPADAPVRAAASGPAGTSGSATPAPAGHLIAVFGHRPPEMGGYGDNAVADSVRRRLTEIVAAKAKVEPTTTVVTGLRLGAEMLGAEAAAEAGVPYVAVLPYPKPHSVWPADAQVRFTNLLAGARDVVLLQHKEPATKQLAGAAMARRDAWLARTVQEAVVVWDGVDANLGRLVRSLQDHLGETEVWLLPPTA